MNDPNTLITFSVSDAAIAQLAAEYMPLKIDGINDTAGFRRVHDARMNVKDKRVLVEKTRKQLKADALEFGRKVDGEAKRLTGLLEPIEAHLDAEEKRIQEEKDAIKYAAQRKAEAEAKAKAEAERQAFLAEQQRQAEERRKLDAERAAIEAEKRRIADEESARQRAIVSEQAKIKAEQDRLERMERERQHAEEVAKARAEAAEKAKAETEARLKREAEAREAAEVLKRQAAEAARLRAESMRPDREKLEAVAKAVRAIQIPHVGKEAAKAASRITDLLSKAATVVDGIIEEEFE